jgi:hypothetical protein
MQHNKNCERFRRATVTHSSNSNGNRCNRFDCTKDAKKARGQGGRLSHHHQLHCCTSGVPQGNPLSLRAFRQRGRDKRGLLSLAATNACFHAGKEFLITLTKITMAAAAATAAALEKDRVVAVAVWWRRQWQCLTVAVAVDVCFVCCALLVVGDNNLSTLKINSLSI